MAFSMIVKFLRTFVNSSTSNTTFYIFNIDDDNSAFSVIFQVELEWNDLNLKFNYLSNSTNTIANLIDLKGWENIWKPNLSFSILTGTAKGRF